MQFTEESWHPHVHDYTQERKRQISRDKRDNKFFSAYNTFLTSGARWLVPSSGPPCFLSPEHFELNFEEDSIFPTQADFYRYAKHKRFADKIIILLPGDELADKPDHRASNELRMRAACFTDKRRYLEQYQRERLPVIRRELARIPDTSLSPLRKLHDYFQPLISSSPFLRQKIGGRILITTTGSTPAQVLIDFTKIWQSVYFYAGEESIYTLHTEGRLLNLVLDRQLSWEELLLSQRVTTRGLDPYSDQIVAFLRLASPEQLPAPPRATE
jgi:UDP-MurNAc hydroxylase